PVFQAEDTVGECGREVTSSSIDKFELTDRDDNGLPRLMIMASLGTKLTSQEYLDACRRGIYPFANSRRILNVPEKQYEVEFMFDGTKFMPVPGSKETIKL